MVPNEKLRDHFENIPEREKITSYNFVISIGGNWRNHSTAPKGKIEKNREVVFMFNEISKRNSLKLK